MIALINLATIHSRHAKFIFTPVVLCTYDKYLSLAKMKNLLQKMGLTKQSSSTIPETIEIPKHIGCADFEKAIESTSFGKFNIILLVITIPACWSAVFETSTMSYVFPSAQCDLDLTLDDKGMLNAIAYAGGLVSAFFWGFLFDTLGRKKVLVYAFWITGFIGILGSFSMNFIFLTICKFCGGFVGCGSYAATATYLSEFHCSKYRSKVQIVLGTINNFGYIYLPLLAWGILPLPINVSLFGGLFEYHSWNLFLLINALPCIISGIIFIIAPESPKFLMSVGKNQEALEVFRTVFRYNTGRSTEDYPITKLINERKPSLPGDTVLSTEVTQSLAVGAAIKKGWTQIVPLFRPPFVLLFILVCSIQLMFTMGQNTLRLWTPQLFQAINDYSYFNNGSSSSFCNMIDSLRPKPNPEKCFVNNDNSEVYINSIMVSSVAILAFAIAGTLINILGKKNLIVILGLLGGSLGISLYFSTNGIVSLAILSVYLSVTSIATNVVNGVVVDLFPTTIRTMSLSLTSMSGRFGSILGNMLFPVLLTLGCGPPFIAIGSIVVACGLLSLFLPNTENKALE